MKINFIEYFSDPNYSERLKIGLKVNIPKFTFFIASYHCGVLNFSSFALPEELFLHSLQFIQHILA